ncbi:MAG: hypothetical protein ACI9S8_001565 [Chlamydiales bacterium]|jgi:hypothetical protein
MTACSVSSTKPIDTSVRDLNSNQRIVQWEGREISVPPSAPILPEWLTLGHVCKGCKNKEKVFTDSKNVRTYLYVSPRPTPTKTEWHKTCLDCAISKHNNSIKRKSGEILSVDTKKPSSSRKKRKLKAKVQKKEIKAEVRLAPLRTTTVDQTKYYFWNDPLVKNELAEIPMTPPSNETIVGDAEWEKTIDIFESYYLGKGYLNENFGSIVQDSKSLPFASETSEDDLSTNVSEAETVVTDESVLDPFLAPSTPLQLMNIPDMGDDKAVLKDLDFSADDFFA